MGPVAAAGAVAADIGRGARGVVTAKLSTSMLSEEVAGSAENEVALNKHKSEDAIIFFDALLVVYIMLLRAYVGMLA